jgi:PIN domain nuclease of toxin-antitoxin system
VIVLDTHTWIWWVSDSSRLSKAARRQIDKARIVGIPAICCLEVAVLAARRRISLDRPTIVWLSDALEQPRVELLPLSPAIAARAADLPASLPGDLADRLIVATAVVESAPLVTRDERLHAFQEISAIW